MQAFVIALAAGSVSTPAMLPQLALLLLFLLLLLLLLAVFFCRAACSRLVTLRDACSMVDRRPAYTSAANGASTVLRYRTIRVVATLQMASAPANGAACTHA
jgi:hypothetical protein